MKHVVFLLFAVILFSSCGGNDTGEGEANKTNAAEANKTNAAADSMAMNIQKMYEIMTSGDVNEFDKYVAANMVEHQMMPGYPPGLEGLKKMVTDMRSAYSDFKMTAEDVIVQGDQVVVRFKMSGKNTGEFMGMPATNKSFEVEGVDWMRMENGKAVEHWGYMEEVKMMQQLGMMPGGEGMGEAPVEGATPAEGEKKDSATGA